jgi:hypothetical protein
MSPLTDPEPTRAVLDALRTVIEAPGARAMFADLGITTLDQALDDGITTAAGDGDLSCYCRVAAVTVDGAPLRADDGRVVGDEVAAHVGVQLFAILDGGDPYFERDGEPFLRTPAGDKPVTENLIRHFLWLWAVMTDPQAARRLLASVPAGIAAEASAHADRTWEMAFADLEGDEGRPPGAERP